MDCRRMIKIGNKNHVVWFGSLGKNENGHAIFFNENDKHDNYAKESEGVATSLEQQLSTLQGELWYSIETGLPLLEKLTSKLELDADISNIITSHKDVIEIKSFTSKIENHKYHANVFIDSIYGDFNLSI